VLVLIGADWADAPNERGERRLDDPSDFVRIEIATALRREIPVIPILLNGASMPPADQLPEDVQPLLRRQACALTDVSFRTGVARLVDQLGEILDDRRKAPPASQAQQRTPASAPARDENAAGTVFAVKRDRLCVLDVRLASERHVISYGIGIWKDKLEVDGDVVARTRDGGRLSFTLSDGGTLVPAVMNVELAAAGTKIGKVTLRLDGAVAYQG
jgi:hypothetical protein